MLSIGIDRFNMQLLAFSIGKVSRSVVLLNGIMVLVTCAYREREQKSR